MNNNHYQENLGMMTVTLIAMTQFLACDGTPDELIEYAGRVCHGNQTNERDTERTEKYVDMLITKGHESVLEHASASFEIVGLSRACSHQLVRHRLASYSQESQRYVTVGDVRMVAPPSIAENGEALYLWGNIMYEIGQTYNALLNLGIPKEDARFVLPNATPSAVVMTANLREWRHILKLRLFPDAQWEIRKMARMILDLLYHNVSRVVFADLWEVYGNE